MKPDGVTGAIEPMKTFESNSVNEGASVMEPEPNQAASPEEITQQPLGEKDQVKPQPDQEKKNPPVKTCNRTSGDSKAKTSNKAADKTKSGATSPTKSTRPNTSQSRHSNGVSKPQINGVAKKSPPTTVKQSTPTTAAVKKTTGPNVASASKSKIGEKKTAGAAPPTTGTKSITGTTAAKKSPYTTTNGVKTSITAATTKKPSAPKPASATPTKPSSAAPTKAPVSKTTRPITGIAAHPATGSTRPPSTSTTKSSLATVKPATPKTSDSIAKSAVAKPTANTPSGGKAPVPQTSRNTTPVKKDVTKSATLASKKTAEPSLSRPPSTTKSKKPETPKSATKSDTNAKKPTASKAADTKTPNYSKTQDSKMLSKDPSKAPGSKMATTKSSSSKKSVGSSTPTPVKRAPKAETVAETGKEMAVAAAVTAAIASAAASTAGSKKPEPPAEAALESFAPDLMFSQAEAVQEKVSDPILEPVSAPVLESGQEPTSEPVPEPIQEPKPEPIEEPVPEPIQETITECIEDPTPETITELIPEPIREPTPEPVREPTPEPVGEPTPEPIQEITPESLQAPIPISEPAQEHATGPTRELTPEPIRKPTPEALQKLTPDLIWETIPEPGQDPSPESPPKPISQQSAPSVLGAEPVDEPAYNVELSAQLDVFKFEESAEKLIPSLGTTVMSPPCSPPGSVSPARAPHNGSSLLDIHIQSDSRDKSQPQTPCDSVTASSVNTMYLQTQDKANIATFEEHEAMEEEEKENQFMPTSSNIIDFMVQPHLFDASPINDVPPRHLISPHEKEEAVEKADEEINEDDDYEKEDEDVEQLRLGHQPSSMVTYISTSQPTEELQIRSSIFVGSARWHGDDQQSGMDSEDVSSCISTQQHGVSDISSTHHTRILEGTQSSDALVDSSLRGSEGDCNLIGSPNVETLANEEVEDEDEEDERVDDMDLSSERVEEHHKVLEQQQRHEDNEEDEDVEMPSEGVTESCENADEDEFNEEERLDNLSCSGPLLCEASTASCDKTNPFSDTWAQPASLLCVSSPSPISDYGAVESETPTLSPAKTHLDSSAHSFALQSEDGYEQHQSDHMDMKKSDLEEVHMLLDGPAVDVAAHSSSEMSTPEDHCDYDSSSGVECRSDKLQTPVPASLHPDMDQDLGIHLEKGDGEEEEAETLPADEVPGTGPPTAPASAPSSPSTSGDEASDTEGEMQINDPDAPVLDESTGFESPTPTCSLPALEEDEEAVDMMVGEGDEDGGGATPQSANSVASYGFDCTTSNSNAHSMAESCGKSPGIFSLENEEQLPEEAKDPSLIKELTLPSAAAAAQAGDRLGRQVDLMPFGHLDEYQSSLDKHHYMFGEKVPMDQLEEVKPMEPSHHFEPQESGDTNSSHPPYYSTICDKTDSFLSGDKNTDEEDEDKLKTNFQEDNWNQNHTTSLSVANGHYLALVPGNRRPIDPTLAVHFAKMASSPSFIEPDLDRCAGGEQLRKLEQHQEKLKEMQLRQEQEMQKKQWLKEEWLRLEQQKQLEKQRRELLQLQEQEHRHRRQVMQWQLELEQQYRMQQKQMQQQLRRSPTGVMLSPSSGLCTIYEAMETSDEEDEVRGEHNRDARLVLKKVPLYQSVTQDLQRQLCPVPPHELEWNKKVDMVQQLINQTLMLSGDGDYPPLLLLPVGTGGTLNPLESSMWPSLLPQFSPPAATVTSVSSYSPDSQGGSPGEWTVVEVETQH